jgi:hypothetical protein
VECGAVLFESIEGESVGVGMYCAMTMGLGHKGRAISVKLVMGHIARAEFGISQN